MIDCNKDLKKVLEKTGLKVYCESFVDSQTKTPCITYLEANNADRVTGDNLSYSDLRFTVKVWGGKKETLMKYACIIDGYMKQEGFKRTMCEEIWLDGQGQKIMAYEAIGIERINGGI